MKTLLMALVAVSLLAACAPSKKLAPTNTVIGTKPAIKKPAADAEKPTKTAVLPNPNVTMLSINGRWKFESSSEKSLSPSYGLALPEISFNETERRVTGTTGCNVFNGFFFTTGELFNFSPLAVKIKKCADATLEKYITRFFKNVGSYKTNGNSLYLYNRNDRDKYVIFTKVNR